MSMLSKRGKQLLLDAAKAFDDGYSPFHAEWLAEREVTADECMALSSHIALVLTGYAHSSEDTQRKVIIVGAAQGSVGAAIVDGLIDRQAAMRRLNNL